MASLFQGTPQTATQTSTNTTATPNWLQDAIYNQVQMSQNVAATPFTPYGGQLTAGLSPLQQQAQQAATSSVGAWQKPYGEVMSGLQAAGEQGAGGAAAAQPYLNQGSRAAYMDVNNYLNPYNTNVTDRIAQLGARNLSQNLLPGVSDQFIKAGQFGGSRMGEFGSRALRDTQESVLGQQGSLLQQGYGQSLQAAQNDADRQVAIARAAADQANADAQFRQSGLAQQASLLQQGQQMRGQDIDRLNALGTQQQGLNQAGLTAAYNQYLMEQGYPQQQVQFATEQLRGLSPLVAGVTQNTQTASGNTGLSPLSQVGAIGSLAGGLFGDKGPLSGVTSGLGSVVGGLSSALGDYAGNWLSSLVGYADGGLVEGDEDEETSTPDDYLQQALARYGVSAPDYSGQSAAAQQRVNDERARLQDMIRAAGETRTAGPSQSELFFKLASAFGTPGKTGSFFEQVGNASGVLAENQQQQRAIEAAHAERAQQFGFEGQKLGLDSAEDELKWIRALEIANQKDLQAIGLAQLKAKHDKEKADGQSKSEFGKFAEDAGLVRGTPEYTQFVNTLRDQDRADKSARAAAVNANQDRGRIPSGYQLNADGSLLAIPGGPADTKLREQDLAKEGARNTFETAIATIDRLAASEGLKGNVGLRGALPNIPGSKAADFAANLETLKAQTFLPMVQSLRGLGALSDAEGKKLNSAVGALDKSMSEEELRESLGRIRADLVAASERANRHSKPASTAPLAVEQNDNSSLDIIVPVTSREEALALPSGARFRTPDGRIKVAP